MATVKFDKIKLSNKTIIKRTFYDSLKISEVIDSFHYILDNQLKEDVDIRIVITDVTQATLKFNMKEFREMIMFVKRNEILSQLKLAVIVDSPIKTIFPTLASTVIGVKVIPFSTLEGAIKWAENN